VQIPGAPIELSLGFSFPPKKPTSSGSPSPSPAPTPQLPISVRCPTGEWIVGGVGRALVGDRYEPVARFYEGYEYIEKILMQGLKHVTYNEAAGFNIEQLQDPDGSLERNATRAYPGGWTETILTYEGYFPDTPPTSNGTATEGWVGNWYFKHANGSYRRDQRRNANRVPPPALKKNGNIKEEDYATADGTVKFGGIGLVLWGLNLIFLLLLKESYLRHHAPQNNQLQHHLHLPPHLLLRSQTHHQGNETWMNAVENLSNYNGWWFDILELQEVLTRKFYLTE
jgi:hypothetical protein